MLLYKRTPLDHLLKSISHILVHWCHALCLECCHCSFSFVFVWKKCSLYTSQPLSNDVGIYQKSQSHVIGLYFILTASQLMYLN